MSDQAPHKNSDQKDVKLKLAGMSYILGDVAMMTAGHLRGESHVFRGGATWMLGGIGAAVFGNPNQEMQLKILMNRLERHLKKNGVEIPTDARQQSTLLKQGSFWDVATEFLYEHPSQILNTAYALGAGMVMHGSLKEGTKNLPANFWMGAVILVGALSGLLLKEKPESEKKSENGNPIAFITNRPLLVSGGAYMAGNIFLAGKIAKDVEKYKNTVGVIKPYFASGTQLGCYLVANSLLMMSPRNQVDKAGFSVTQIGQLQEAAASIIAAQPKEVQASLIKDMSEFMSKQAGISLKPEQLEAQLKQQLHTVTTTTPAERRYTTRLAQREAAEQTSHSL